MQNRLGFAVLAIYLGISIAACVSQPSRPQFVIASGAWLGGWRADGSQLLIYTINGDVFVVSVDNTSFPRVEYPWDFSQAIDKGLNFHWSPDGMSVLYDSKSGEETGSRDLYLLNAPGQVPDLLFSFHAMIGPVWSSDSKQFAAIVDGMLRLYDRDGRNYRDILLDVSDTWGLDWSPDSKVLALSDDTRTKFLDVESGQTIDMVGFPTMGIQATWSPDSQFVALIEPWRNQLKGNLIIAKLDGTQRIMLAGVKDPSASQLSADEFLYSDPSWSPRGDYIAVRRISAAVHQSREQESYEVILIPVPDDLK